MKRLSAVILILAMALIVIPQGALSMPGATQATTAISVVGGEIHVARYDATDQYQPSVAYNWKHQEYFVVWHNNDVDGVQRIYGQRVDARTGELLGAQPDAIAGGALDKYEPDVDYDPVNDRYLVVWTHALSAAEYNVSGRFVPWEGSSPTQPEFPITEFSCYEYDPRVAYGRANQQFMVVGTHFCGGNPEDVWAQMVPADGTGFNPMTGITVDAHGTYGRTQPDIAWNRATNEFLVVYSYELLAGGGGTEWDTYGVLFDGTGTQLPGNLYFGISTNDELYPAVAAAGNNDTWLVVWQEMVGGDYDLKGYMFRGDMTWVSSPVISAYAGHQQHARVGSNYGENGFMVVYEEDIGGNIGISARPLNLDGTMENGFQVQYPSSAPGNINPAIIGGHSNYLAVWQNRRESDGNRDIYGKFLTPYANYLPLALKIP